MALRRCSALSAFAGSAGYQIIPMNLTKLTDNEMAKYLNEQHGEYQLFYNNLMFKSFKSSKSYKNEDLKMKKTFIFL